MDDTPNNSFPEQCDDGTVLGQSECTPDCQYVDKSEMDRQRQLSDYRSTGCFDEDLVNCPDWAASGQCWPKYFYWHGGLSVTYLCGWSCGTCGEL